jgi:hypothetical protein
MTVSLETVASFSDKANSLGTEVTRLCSPLAGNDLKLGSRMSLGLA